MKMRFPTQIPMMWAMAIVLATVMGGALVFMASGNLGGKKPGQGIKDIPLIAVSENQVAAAVKKDPAHNEGKAAQSQLALAAMHHGAPLHPQVNDKGGDPQGPQQGDQKSQEPVKEGETPVANTPASSSSAPAIPEIPALPASPFLKPDCVEQRAEGVLLPIISKAGLRPFDVYQSDFRATPDKIKLTIVVTELGLNPGVFEQIQTQFPPFVTCAFLAHQTLSKDQAQKARLAGREVVLMVPLEPMDYPRSDPGFQTLLTALPPLENKKRLESHLSQLTGYMAVMPFGGDRFCRVKQDLKPILKELDHRGLAYFEPRQTRSLGASWKPEKMMMVKGNYDILRSDSAHDIKDLLALVTKDLSEKNSVIVTIQADKVNLEMVKEWLPTVLKDPVVLAPLSAHFHP